MIVELEAKSFRNLEPLRQVFGAGTHLVLGSNGAGKTSLLEATYLCATTRSFRTSQLGDCRTHGEMGFHLAAEIEGEAYCRLDVSWVEGRLERRLNGKRSPLAQHLAVLPVVCWTTRDSEVLVGSPEERRRFIDRGVIATRPTTLADYTRYRHALESKRRLLSTGCQRSEIEVWNQMLAESAARLVRHRSDYVERLANELSKVLEICGFDFPAITIRYRPSPVSALEGVESLAAELERLIDRERKLERPLAGPHRDELVVRWEGHGIRRVASAGERKALGLSLFAAQGRLLAADGRNPLYLLDDVDSELDRQRLEALWRVFGESRQLLATSNRPEIWRGLGLAHRWQCLEGRLLSH